MAKRLMAVGLNHSTAPFDRSPADFDHSPTLKSANPHGCRGDGFWARA